MPAPAVLPAILMKSLLLAAGVGYVAHRSKHVSILLLLAVVAFYQLAGTLGEWALSGSLHTALQDFRIGLPGMALQVFGGYFFIKYLIYNKQAYSGSSKRTSTIQHPFNYMVDFKQAVQLFETAFFMLHPYYTFVSFIPD